VDTEWERMIKRHDRIIDALRSLKTETRKHFKERYHGKAFNEWIEILFDVPTTKLRTSKATCKKILAETRKNSSRIAKIRTP